MNSPKMFNCECGPIIKKCSRQVHFVTDKHINYLKLHFLITFSTLEPFFKKLLFPNGPVKSEPR